MTRTHLLILMFEKQPKWRNPETSDTAAIRAWVETAIVHLETVARVEARDHTDQPVTQVIMVTMVGRREGGKPVSQVIMVAMVEVRLMLDTVSKLTKAWLVVGCQSMPPFECVSSKRLHGTMNAVL